MENAIVGRDAELEILKQIYASKEPHFLTVYGRRRIGKTFLISEFFKDKGIYFAITGMKNGTLREQLFQYAYEFARQFNDGQPISPPKSWDEALHELRKAIEKADKNQKCILFFDEVPWLASPRSRFLSALEYFWNHYASKNANIIMIICGSSASWILRNIIHNTRGLYGRVTRTIRLLPFTLGETEQYLQSRHIALDKKQIIDIYMALGGVPKYLSYIQRGKSAAQNINDICFSYHGALYNEFDNLYKSLFDHHEHHIAMVKALSATRDGLTKDELLQKTKLTSGGSSSRIIEDLVDAGFIVCVPSFHKKKVGGVYRLIDEYTLFYLSWLVDASKVAFGRGDTTVWIKKCGTPAWRAWSGLAFESLCLKHLEKIRQALGIAGVTTMASGWRYRPKRGQGAGAQIDLVIDRADKCINLCEMKYSDTEFTVDKSYGEKLRYKKEIFRQQTKTMKALFLTMITTYGAVKNMHYLSEVDAEVTMESLF